MWLLEKLKLHVWLMLYSFGRCWFESFHFFFSFFPGNRIFSFFLRGQICVLFFPALLWYNWQITLSLHCTTWWFDICICYEMRLVNTSITSHSYHFVCVCVCERERERIFKIYSLSKFQVYNTVLLTTATKVYIRSPELIHLITEPVFY